MRFLRSLLRYAALILIVGGVFMMFLTYITKKEILLALVSNTIVKSSMSVLRTIVLSIGAIFVGLIIFMLSMKLSSSIRKADRERNEELRLKEKENKETTKRLEKEAEQARKEAEEARKEAERMKESLMAAEENKVEEKQEA